MRNTIRYIKEDNSQAAVSAYGDIIFGYETISYTNISNVMVQLPIQSVITITPGTEVTGDLIK